MNKPLRIPRQRPGHFDRGPGFYIETKAGNDLGEGPFETLPDVMDFIHAEVGIVCRAIRVETPQAYSKWITP